MTLENSQGSRGLTPAKWIGFLESAEAAVGTVFEQVYGGTPGMPAARDALFTCLLHASHEHLGDHPVRLFRAPGRINLRGMHVDTHGGYLNLMTHQREIVIAAAPSRDHRTILWHAEPGYASTSIDPGPMVNSRAFRGDWRAFLASPEGRAAASGRRGDWSLYAEGAVLSIQHRFPDKPLQGMRAVVAGDLPQGAALSSSAALCVACCLALLAVNDLTLPPAALIEAAQDAEWYTGSRCGIADQAAIVLGGRSEVINAALQPGALDTNAVRRIPLPEEARIVVVNSHTTRSISGAQQVAYTRNRFAYSMAVDILHQELAQLGLPAEARERMRSFAALTPARLAALPGAPGMYALLKSVPESLTIEEMRSRYELPTLDHQYRTWFGALPEPERPRSFHLRGPLLFGLAESERARHFGDFIARGDLAAAGHAMTIGHDGDRVRAADGSPWLPAISDADLDALASADVPIWQCAGAYGASSPALDDLVDTALGAGALGASLTGAGIAGTVLALCTPVTAEPVAEALRARLSSPGYAALAGLSAPLGGRALLEAVLLNDAPAGAGEIVLPNYG